MQMSDSLSPEKVSVPEEETKAPPLDDTFNISTDPALPNLISIGSPLVRCHLLLEAGKEECTLIDTGLWFERLLVRKTMKKLGRPMSAISRILITHGHLDHIGSLARLAEETGAETYIHPADLQHALGEHNYGERTRRTGQLEAFGRAILNWDQARPKCDLSDGQKLPVWGGLEVIHLPGHTHGHCGFLSRAHRTFFIGDIIASYRHSTHHPTDMLNDNPEQLLESFQRVLEITEREKIEYLLPNHYDLFEPAEVTKRILDFSKNTSGS